MNLVNVAKNGTYYYPAYTHYNDNHNINVICDRCNTGYLKVCIGLNDKDLCLPCVHELLTFDKSSIKTITVPPKYDDLDHKTSYVSPKYDDLDYKPKYKTSYVPPKYDDLDHKTSYVSPKYDDLDYKPKYKTSYVPPKYDDFNHKTSYVPPKYDDFNHKTSYVPPKYDDLKYKPIIISENKTYYKPNYKNCDDPNYKHYLCKKIFNTLDVRGGNAYVEK
jgi:hypothetical protein